MRTLIRLAIAFINFVLWAMVGATLCVMCSCARVQYVPVETIKTDSVRVVDIQRDSIYVQDSVIVREKADTVFVTRWRTEYRDRVVRDTVFESRVDSVQNVVEVERDFTPWESMCFSLGRVMLTIAAFILVYKLYILFRKLRK
jgi:nitrous oxide reductase